MKFLSEFMSIKYLIKRKKDLVKERDDKAC